MLKIVKKGPNRDFEPRFRVTRAPVIKILMSITTTRYDLTTKTDFMKKHQKLAEIFSKNLENHGFL